LRSLYLRIWLTVIVTLALFAGASGWLVQRHLDQERIRNQAAINERIAAWGDLIQRSLPAASAPPEVQSEALRDWSQRLRVPMALQDEQGHRIAGIHAFYDGRKAHQVGKNETALLPASSQFEGFVMLNQVSHQIGRDITRESLFHPALADFDGEMPHDAGRNEGQAQRKIGDHRVEQRDVREPDGTLSLAHEGERVQTDKCSDEHQQPQPTGVEEVPTHRATAFTFGTLG
jgi:hypothetical protein